MQIASSNALILHLWSTPLAITTPNNWTLQWLFARLDYFSVLQLQKNSSYLFLRKTIKFSPLCIHPISGGSFSRDTCCHHKPTKLSLRFSGASTFSLGDFYLVFFFRFSHQGSKLIMNSGMVQSTNYLLSSIEKTKVTTISLFRVKKCKKAYLLSGGSTSLTFLGKRKHKAAHLM